MSESNAPNKRPIVTYTVIGLCVLIYLWEVANFDAVWTALVEPILTGSIFSAWTLFTMTLVHSKPPDLMHIVFNLMAFSVLGRLLETLYGSLRFALLLIVLAWVASAAEINFDHSIGIGLSGVIYGIFGFMIGASPRSPFLWWFVKKNAPMLIGWAVLCVFLTQTHVLAIGNGAHFGGLIYGIIYGLIYGLPKYRYALIGLAVLVPITVGAMLPSGVASVIQRLERLEQEQQQ